MFPLAGSEFGSYIKVCDDIALTFVQRRNRDLLSFPHMQNPSLPVTFLEDSVVPSTFVVSASGKIGWL